MTTATVPAPRRRKTLTLLWRVLVHIVLYGFALLSVFPFLWMLSTSLKPEGEVFTWPPRLLPWPLAALASPRWAPS